MRRRIASVAAIVAFLMLAAYLLREPISCYFFLRSNPTGLIAFFRLDHLYVMDRQGNNQCRIAEGDLRFGVWSPDGTRLAFIDYNDHKLFVINADGSGLRKLAEGNEYLSLAAPSWSPDSRQLAYIGLDANGGNTISMVNVDSGESHNLNTALALTPIVVSWSPDASQFAFTAGEDEMWVVDVDGSNLTQIPRNAEHTIRTPQWLSDSQHVLFVAPSFELARANTTDITVEEITTLIDDNIGGIFDFDLSPSGDRVLLSVLVGDGLAHVFLLDFASNELVQLTEGDVNDWRVEWMPDGTQILFERYSEFDRSIFRLDLTTHEVRFLANGRDPFAQPSTPE